MTPSPPTQFQPGALVRLRSGGPVMTVRQTYDSCGELFPQPTACCRWFLEGVLKEDNFSPHELEAVQDSRWLDQPDGPGYWWCNSNIASDLVLVGKDHLHADQEIKVMWHGEERWQYLSEITGHKWCKAADEPPARP